MYLHVKVFFSNVPVQPLGYSSIVVYCRSFVYLGVLMCFSFSPTFHGEDIELRWVNELFLNLAKHINILQNASSGF